jgi:hypothetical protein
VRDSFTFSKGIIILFSWSSSGEELNERSTPLCIIIRVNPFFLIILFFLGPNPEGELYVALHARDWPAVLRGGH